MSVHSLSGYQQSMPCSRLGVRSVPKVTPFGGVSVRPSGRPNSSSQSDTCRASWCVMFRSRSRRRSRGGRRTLRPSSWSAQTHRQHTTWASAPRPMVGSLASVGGTRRRSWARRDLLLQKAWEGRRGRGKPRDVRPPLAQYRRTRAGRKPTAISRHPLVVHLPRYAVISTSTSAGSSRAARASACGVVAWGSQAIGLSIARSIRSSKACSAR